MLSFCLLINASQKLFSEMQNGLQVLKRYHAHLIQFYYNSGFEASQKIESGDAEGLETKSSGRRHK